MSQIQTEISPACPIRTTLEMVGGKWRLLIIAQLIERSRGYGELNKAIPEISDKMLFEELRSLEENKLILKQTISERPKRVRYELTDLGKEVIPLLGSMKNFADRYTEIRSAEASSSGNTEG